MNYRILHDVNGLLTTQEVQGESLLVEDKWLIVKDALGKAKFGVPTGSVYYFRVIN